MFITDEQVLVLAIELLYIVLWSGLLLGCFIALSSIMRASGDVVIPRPSPSRCSPCWSCPWHGG